MQDLAIGSNLWDLMMLLVGGIVRSIGSFILIGHWFANEMLMRDSGKSLVLSQGPF